MFRAFRRISTDSARRRAVRGELERTVADTRGRQKSPYLRLQTAIGGSNLPVASSIKDFCDLPRISTKRNGRAASARPARVYTFRYTLRTPAMLHETDSNGLFEVFAEFDACAACAAPRSRYGRENRDHRSPGVVAPGG